jgi:hypothetical protein
MSISLPGATDIKVPSTISDKASSGIQYATVQDMATALGMKTREMTSGERCKQHTSFLVSAWNFADKPPGQYAGTPLEQHAYTTQWLLNTVAHGGHCPFVSSAVLLGNLWLTNCPESSKNGEDLFQYLMHLKEIFLAMEPTQVRQRIRKAIVTLMPLAFTTDEMVNLSGTTNEYGAFINPSGVELGTFLPSCSRSKLPDPFGKTPPVFVLRHSNDIITADMTS